MLYEYYSPVVGMNIAFYCIERQQAESWNMDRTAADSSSLNGKSSRGADSLCYIELDIFL